MSGHICTKEQAMSITLNVSLREMTEADLPILFEQQTDPEANTMAAFTAEDPNDREAYMAHWEQVLNNAALIKRVILFEGQVAGYLVKFNQFGNPSIGYWLGREFWGKGIATQGVKLFLTEIPERPLYARVAKDNIGSQRVLEKCGFVIYGEDKGFAYARGTEIEEWIFQLT
jgi:RimJ/RimL family protein N-acetyltransferase